MTTVCRTLHDLSSQCILRLVQLFSVLYTDHHDHMARCLCAEIASAVHNRKLLGVRKMKSFSCETVCCTVAHNNILICYPLDLIAFRDIIEPTNVFLLSAESVLK